jgi:hypothetical protein
MKDSRNKLHPAELPMERRKNLCAIIFIHVFYEMPPIAPRHVEGGDGSARASNYLVALGLSGSGVCVIPQAKRVFGVPYRPRYSLDFVHGRSPGAGCPNIS